MRNFASWRQYKTLRRQPNIRGIIILRNRRWHAGRQTDTTDRPTYRHTDIQPRQTDRQTDKQHVQTYRQTDRRTDGQTDGQCDHYMLAFGGKHILLVCGLSECICCIDTNRLWYNLIRLGIDWKLRSLYSEVYLCVKHLGTLSNLFNNNIWVSGWRSAFMSI